MTDWSDVWDGAKAIARDTVALRRAIHEHPELGNDLPITRQLVLDALPDDLSVLLDERTSGIRAFLEGDSPGPTMLLRADMDALPIQEETGLDFSSSHPGVMHACGHDTHAAMLVGAARLLAARRDRLKGRVLFMFQPGEEGHYGARTMIEEGLLDVPPLSDGSSSPVASAFAIHITSSMPIGMFRFRPGPYMASSDELHVVVRGRGGHGSQPFRALDPVPAACEMVLALQTMVTRSIDVFDPAVISIGRIAGGRAMNVIPETVEVAGTIRTMTQRTRAVVLQRIREVVAGIAAVHGVECDLRLVSNTAPVINDEDAAARLLRVIKNALGPGALSREQGPIMAGEDFSEVLDRVPGVLCHLGAAPAGSDHASAPPNHSNRVVFDESALVDGTAIYAAMALERLS